MSKMTIEFNYRDDKVIGSTMQKGGREYEEYTDKDFDSKKASLIIAMKILDFSKDDIDKVIDALNYKDVKKPFDNEAFKEGKIVIRCKTKEQYNSCVSILAKYYNYDKSMMIGWGWDSTLRKYNYDEEVTAVFIDSSYNSLDWGVNETVYVEYGQRIINFEDIIFDLKGEQK